MNRIIIQALKNLDDAKGLWAKKFLETLWVYRTTHNSSIGEMSFQLTFSIEVVILVEIGLTNFRVTHYDRE